MHIASREHWSRAWMIDVSSHGARFRGAHLPRPGTRVRVAMRVPCHMLKLTGAVVWNERPRAAAVEFDPLTRDQQVLLDTALLEAESPADGANEHGAVLLMIDDPVTQAAIGRAVRDRGLQPIARLTPLDAIQTLVNPGPPLRAAIVSAGLPHRAGHDVLDFLARECPQARRVLLVEPHQTAARRSGGRPRDCIVSSPYYIADIVPMLAELDRGRGDPARLGTLARRMCISMKTIDPSHTPSVSHRSEPRRRRLGIESKTRGSLLW